MTPETDRDQQTTMCSHHHHHLPAKEDPHICAICGYFPLCSECGQPVSEHSYLEHDECSGQAQWDAERDWAAIA